MRFPPVSTFLRRRPRPIAGIVTVRLSVIRIGAKHAGKVPRDVGRDEVVVRSWLGYEEKGKGRRKHMFLAGYVYYFKDIRKGVLLSYCV